MGVGIYVTIFAVLAVVCLVIFKKKPDAFIKRIQTVTVEEVLDAFSTGVVVATKQLPKLLSLTDDATRKYLLALWYWYSFAGSGFITPVQQRAFVDAWNELDSKIKIEAAQAYQKLSIEHRNALDTQMGTILRQKNLDYDKIKRALCILSNREHFLEHCGCGVEQED